MDNLIINNMKNLINIDGKADFCADFSYISGKTILVTGAGGSIGSELCLRLSELSPKHLIVLDICENGIFELCEGFTESRFSGFSAEILSVTDKVALERVFEKYKPDIVFHAAAHKHVPLMECCPSEAVKNNVFGTLNTAQLSIKYGAEKFFLISTDKAVDPVSIMGATKRICECVVGTLCGKETEATKMITVRFGNVIGSNGSVIPLFERQIRCGKAVTVTHPDCTRFFMSIPKAVEFVISAGSIAKGGEIFVADMGEPVNVFELAKELIREHGFEPGKDIKIDFVGLRPGEKLCEELFCADEKVSETKLHGIWVCNDGCLCSEKSRELSANVLQLLPQLKRSCEACDDVDVVNTLKKLFPGLEK